ncbi:MAG TPA: penicillin-binding transpeptidase domain-containing protein [Candidatus Acidoferrum sp.]|nr:penicillin-binding transpeptidase domain-containing protein [Candidatus Acidoferrum sp.]
MRHRLVVVLALTGMGACSSSNVATLRSSQTAPGHNAGPSATTAADLARQILRDAHAAGFIDVTEVSSGRQIAYVGLTITGEDDPSLTPETLVPPLSVIKLFVAAEWLERGFANVVVECAPSGGHAQRRMRVDEMLISGCDSAGARMATILRQKLGAETVVRDLQRFGLGHLALRSDASDAGWEAVLTLGERNVPVTAREVSAFLRDIARDGATVMSADTARRLRNALDDVVGRGTATSIKDELAGTGWRIGGKTGTGPGDCGDRCDGWFASLASNRQQACYVILAYVRGKGLGSGVAAHAAAMIARHLAEEAPRAAD